MGGGEVGQGVAGWAQSLQACDLEPVTSPLSRQAKREKDGVTLRAAPLLPSGEERNSGTNLVLSYS